MKLLRIKLITVSSIVLISAITLIYYLQHSDFENKPTQVKIDSSAIALSSNATPIVTKVVPTIDNSVATIKSTEIAQLAFIEKNPLPPSLEDVIIDGDISFDSNGRLIQSLELRQLFDHLLTLENEWDEQAIRIWLIGYATASTEHLNSPVEGYEQVLKSYDTYVEYLKEADALVPEPGFAESSFIVQFSQVFATRYKLRRSILGAMVAENFYAEDEAYDRSQYEHALIFEDKTLNSTRRQERIVAWRNSLPAGQKQTELEHEKFRSVSTQVDELRSIGADSQAIYTAWEEAYGTDAAERLSEVDLRQAAWHQRLEQYIEYYQQLLQDQQLPQAQANAIMLDYIQQSFSKQEAKRLPILVQ